MKPEKRFQKDLATTAAVMNCLIIDIPDMIVPKGWVKQRDFKEARRPFDCILVTGTKMFGIELKYAGGTQSVHQKQKERLYNSVNPKAYYVVRKWQSKKRNTPMTTTYYDIKQDGKVIFRTEYMPDIIDWFKGI